MALWHHRAFRVPFAAHGSPMLDPRRGDDAVTWALDEGVVHRDQVFVAPEVSYADIARVHPAAYLETLDRPEVLARILAVPEALVPVDGVLEFWRRGCGAVLEGARRSLRTLEPSVCTAGGFHHAEPAKGGGFCAINDIAIAVAALRAEGLQGRILVLDFDAHPPDGTVACLADDEGTWVHSVSVASDWEVPDGPRVLDARVAAGTEDGAYLHEVDRVLAASPRAVQLVIYLAGTDPLDHDPLGSLMVSEEGLRERDERVFRRFRNTPIVAVPAGGYTDRAWRVLAHTISVAAGLSNSVAPDYDALGRRTRYVAHHIDPRILTGTEDELEITEADLFGDLGMGAKKEPRFLGYYTRHGMEHALDVYGFLPALRGMGFHDLQVHIEVSEGHDRLRVDADLGGRREDLVDLAVSRRAMHGFQVLFVEWLEMRDPRVSFGPERPQLPGQRGPGLGMAPEVGHLLVVAADRLGLDGVGLVPAHYHVAWMSRHDFVAIDPEDRGHFRAVVRHLSEVSLRTATQLMDKQGLATEDGKAITWWKPEMVTPRGDALKEYIAATEDQAKRAQRSLAMRLVPLPAQLNG